MTSVGASDNGITPLQQMASSCTGAIVTSIIVTPLDVVKIRMQAQQKEFLKNKCFLYCNGLMEHICYCNGNGNANGSKDAHHNVNTKPFKNGFSSRWYSRPTHFTGTLDGIFKIARHEGIPSLWSGLPPTLVMAVPATVVYFTMYDQIRERFKLLCGSPKQQPLWIPLVAGTCARTLAATLISPMEMVRTKMQSKKLSYFEVGRAVKSMVKSEGVSSLYRGLTATLLRDVPFSAIYWTSYEYLKTVFEQREPSFHFAFVAGASAGTVAAIVTLPFDVVKTHRQIELGEQMFAGRTGGKSSSWCRTCDALRHLYRQRGLSAVFAGLSPRIIKVAPACAIMISTYECGKSFFRKYNSLSSNRNQP